MRRTCQVFVGTKRCGKPAVDFVEIEGMDFGINGNDDPPEVLVTRIPMCVDHWDDYQKRNHDKP